MSIECSHARISQWQKAATQAHAYTIIDTVLTMELTVEPHTITIARIMNMMMCATADSGEHFVILIVVSARACCRLGLGSFQIRLKRGTGLATLSVTFDSCEMVYTNRWVDLFDDDDESVGAY